MDTTSRFVFLTLLKLLAGVGVNVGEAFCFQSSSFALFVIEVGDLRCRN